MSASEKILSHLLDCGMHDRVISEGRGFLERDVEDSAAHFYLALVLSDLSEFREAQQHVEHLLAADPESVRAHIAAVHFYAKSHNPRKVSLHVTEGMRIHPEMPYFHQHAATLALSRLKMKEAKAHITRARELDPDDPHLANLYIHIHGSLDPTVGESLANLRKFKEALQLDPLNPALHHSIGSLYLDELDDPQAAEIHFREALRTAPQDRDHQKGLFQAVAEKSLVYRLFSIPSRSFADVGNALHGLRLQPWRMIFLLVGFKFIMAYFLWLLMATLVFWPGGKAYEWLLVSEIRKGGGLSTAGLRVWFWIRKWPVWARLAVFLFGNFLLWAGLFLWLKVPLATGAMILAAFVSVSFIWIALKSFSKRYAARRERKRMRKQGNPPPFPRM